MAKKITGETAPDEENVAPETNSDTPPIDSNDEKVDVAPAELEPAPVSTSLTIEQQIEAWRDQANDVCLSINKVPGHQPGLERLLNKIVKEINRLNEQYAKDNATEGFQVLIERKPGGLLIVEAGSSHEAYGFREDLETKITDYLENDKDSLIEVTSSKSINTKSAKILVSSINGYSVQSFQVYKDYESTRKLIPLDELVLRQPAVPGNVSNRTILR